MLTQAGSVKDGQGVHPITIAGPALVGGPFFNIDLANAAGPKRVTDVHIISPWSYNTDAFNVGSRATVSNCFAFVNDDIFSPEWVKYQYAGQYWDIAISDCVTAGRNHVNVGYGMFGSSPGVPMTDNFATLSSIDVVLHLPLPDTVQTGFAPGVMKSRVGNATNRVTALENTIVRNLRVEGNVHRLFSMKNDGAFLSPPLMYGNTVNILFDNVELIGAQAAKSELDGFDVSNMLRVEFRNLVIGGTRVTQANASTFFNIGPYAVATFN